MVAILLMERDKMSNHNRGLSIDASYQVSVHLAKRFQREESNFFNSFLFFTDFHKRPGLATISLKLDHICIISIMFGGNWLFTGF
jgi:hypothetical protein